VLRSERSRFQLFGDTVNTAARMEQTGRPSMIQISQATADLLVVAGKEHWIKPRDSTVEAKGKGMLQTYWVYPTLTSKSGSTSDESDNNVVSEHSDSHGYNQTEQVQRFLSDKTIRLVDWNVAIMCRVLKLIVAYRQAAGPAKTSHRGIPHVYLTPSRLNDIKDVPLNEVVEIVSLPCFDAKVALIKADIENVELPEKAVQQLREFVTNVAAM
jgi:hypothetical protein